MRQIGTLETESQARQLITFLVAQRIDALAEPEGTRWAVWVKTEDQVPQAKAELARYLEHPQDARYQGLELEAEKVRRAEWQKRQQAVKSIEAGRQWRGVSMRKAPLTFLLIVLSLLLSLISNFGRTTGDTLGNTVMEQLSFCRGMDFVLNENNPLASLRQGELWRLVTPILLHGSLMHLIFNMLWLYQLGVLFERRYHTALFGCFVLVVAAASNFGQAMMPSDWGGSPFAIGMSGVVYGLFGRFWWQGHIDPARGRRMPLDTELMMLFWLMLGFLGVLDGMAGGKIANWAHLYGLLAGMAWAHVAWLLRKA